MEQAVNKYLDKNPDMDGAINLTQPTSTSTRDRLLIQAESLFSQKGFAAVSVREITTEAKSNLAAVNYHFGNKMNLYLAVFKERWVPIGRRVRRSFHEYLSEKTDPGISGVMRAVVMAFFEGAMTDAERRCHIQLMQREMASPTEAINLVVDEVIRPMHNDMIKQMHPFLPEKLSVEQSSLLFFSIISMILYFGFARPVISLIMDQEFDPAFKSRVIDHIVAFAVSGINGLKKEEIV